MESDPQFLHGNDGQMTHHLKGKSSTSGAKGKPKPLGAAPKPSRGRASPLERVIQRQIVGFAQRALPPGSIFLAVPNQSVRGVREYAALKADGMRPGASDLYTFSGGVTLWAEVKRPCNRSGPFRNGVTAEQQAFGDDVRSQGGAFEVVRSVEDYAAACARAGIKLRATP